MKRRFYLLLCLLLCSSCFYTLQAQNDSIPSAKPQFKISVNYNSNLNYFGRTDSLLSSGVFPLAELWIGAHFYINASPIFINNAVQNFKYTGTLATIGYQHMTEKWMTNISLLKPLYKENTALVQSALKAQGNLNITRLNKILNVTVGADVKFSDNVDFGATAGVDHMISMEGKRGGIWIIDPSFYAYAGTQQFSRTYTEQRSGGLLPIRRGGTTQQTTETTNEFNILAYEASVPFIYVKGKVMLLLTPSYIVPQNLLQVENHPELSEKGENTFYATFGIKYSF